jgi:hypothetical protein
MPLFRYFAYVGGALLALLFVASAFVPEAVPVAERDATKPVIRITSDRVGPPRVDFDTRLQLPPAPVPLSIAPLRTAPREAMAQLAEPKTAAAVAPPAVSATSIKSEAKIEHKKTRVAKRPDRRLIAAYPQPFQPFRWMW